MKLRSLFAVLAMFVAGMASAAVDVNRASQAELETVSGVGPAIAGKILDERKKGAFKNWDDFIERVKGVGEGNAAKLSAGGLTIGGAGYKGTAAPAAKAVDNKVTAKDDKPAAKPTEKKEAAVAAKDAKDAKPVAKDDKAAAAKNDKAVAASKDKKPADDDKTKKDAKPDAKKS